MYNETDKSLIQITSDGKLTKSINDFTQELNYNRTLVDVVDFAKINSTQTISNAGKDFWATSSPLESTVYVFKNEELFYTHTEPSSANYTEYGIHILVQEDENGQPIMAIASKDALDSNIYYIDLWKPFVLNGTNQFVLW
jgi:hypothetical protein